MKAIVYTRYGGPEVLELVEQPEPAPTPDEVLIDVHATSVVPGDWKMRAGHLKDIFAARFPVVPGRDGSGVVVACGANVTSHRVGDEVVFMTDRIASGSYLERIARPAAHVVRKPDNVSHLEAAAANHTGVCAWLGLVDVARVKRGDRVFIVGGSGAIGGFAVQLARHLGATVAATCRASNVEYVRSLGAHSVSPHDREDFSATLRDYDVVFDLVGGEAHERAYRVLRPGGVMAYLIALPFRDRSAEFGVETKRVPIDERRDALQAAMDLIGSGAVKSHVERVFPLHEAAAAHRFLETGAHVRGRVVLQIR